jgi:hypothetical protein
MRGTYIRLAEPLLGATGKFMLVYALFWLYLVRASFICRKVSTFGENQLFF